MRVEEIASQVFSLRDLFKEVSYEIDAYQREYTWGQGEVRTLLTDLCGTFNAWNGTYDRSRKYAKGPQYFLGPFVYHPERKGRRFLVDGQQRFVTLHLLFLHLRRLVKGIGDEHSLDRLNRVIRRHDQSFCIAIPDHERVLKAISEDRPYELGPGDSLSTRNLWARSQEIEPLLRDELDAESYTRFTNWLLDRVVMAGILAATRDDAYRMFETMNDRGARLTVVDLLKSHLLTEVRADEHKLNDQWRTMLSELTIDREDTSAPTRFLKAVLLARHADPASSGDRTLIEDNLNRWVRTNAERLGLRGPERYFAFVNELLELARRYRTWLAATRDLQAEFGALYFNERNGLGMQMVPILAAVDPIDIPSVAHEKARRVAAFLDYWFVQRVLQDFSVRAADVEELIFQHLVGPLRKCRTPDEVTAVLSDVVAADAVSFLNFTTFGFRGNNRGHVRYVLSRITAHLEEALDRFHDITKFLDGAEFQIEHLWPNEHAHVAAEIPDEVVFRDQRNRLGGLGLLRSRDNASINALPFHEKTKTVYGRQNTPLGILAPGYNTRNSVLRQYVNDNGLSGLLRPFGDSEPMTTIIETRQQLYLRLCATIWNPVALKIANCDPLASPVDGTDSAGPPSSQRPPTRSARRKVKGRSDIARMLNAGVLEADTRIVLTYQGRDHWAHINADGMIVVEATGTPYSRADEAGIAVRGTNTCVGMAEWHIVRNSGERISLRDLREEATRTGRLGRSRR